ncbi:MAG: AAA family ATPase [Gemmatimonadota bacterium]|nr:AAA family ATPase [Gemmatimonadota bacterium]
MSTTFHLRLLGTVSLTRVGVEPAPILLGRGKALAALAYLLCSPRRSCSRDHLVDLLWADSEPIAGRRNLRQMLYTLRELLGEAAIAGVGDVLTLHAEIGSDRAEFLAAFEAGDAARAVGCYHGDFFPAFASAGSAVFEHWADLERLRLRDAHQRCLEFLTRAELAANHPREAVGLARRLRDADPSSELGWRVLLEALVSAGDWAVSAVEADEFERRMRDVGQTPAPATLRLLLAARQAPIRFTDGGGRLLAEMVGREAELATILGLWHEVQVGRLRHLLVLGTAGIGKSRLLGDAAARLAALGARLVLLRANQGERGLAWALAGDLTRALFALPGAAAVSPESLAALAELDPGIAARFRIAERAPASPEESLRRRILALTDLLTAIADEHPLAVMLDDLHWADPLSLRLLAGVASRCTSVPILLLTTSRPVTLPDAARADLTLTLRPLERDQLGELMRSIAETPAPLRASAFLEQLRSATGGLPLQVVQELQLALEIGCLRKTAESWIVVDQAALERQLRVANATERRLAHLLPAERSALLLLAVAGMPVPEAILAEAAQRLGLSGHAVLSSLEQRGIAVLSAGSWSCGHDLLQEPLVAGASDAERGRVAVALGQALATASPEHVDPRVPVRLLIDGHDLRTVTDLFLRYEAGRRARHDWRHPEILAQELIGEEHGVIAGRLVQGLPWHRRWRLRAPGRMGAAGATVALLLLLLVTAAFMNRRPHHLALRQQPVFAAPLLDPPLVIDVLDRLGRPTSLGSESLRVTLGWHSGVERIEGETSLSGLHSPVTFGSMRARSTSDSVPKRFTMRVSMPGVPPLETDTITGSAWLTLDSVRLDERTVAGPTARFAVRRGQPLNGWAFCRITNPNRNAVMLLAVIPTWGDRRRSYSAGREVPNGAAGAPIKVPLNLTAPGRPGENHIILVAAMETEAQYIASGTNWVFGSPVWDDGNDIVDWSRTQLDQARRLGLVTGARWMLPVDDSLKTTTRLSAESRRSRSIPAVLGAAVLPAAVLDIVVTP